MSLYHHIHIFPFLILLSLTLHTSAENLDVRNNGKETFIVRISNEAKPSSYPDVEEWYKSILTGVSFNPNEDGYFFLYVYKSVFNGFSSRLTSDEVRALRSHPAVVDVFPDVTYQTHTTWTPHFMGLNSYHSPTGLLKDSNLGSEVIVGLIDTGVWPESLSFKDDGLGPVPAHFKGTCDGGKDFPSSFCNKKLVGARYFSAGMASVLAIDKKSTALSGLKTARDDIGHGTHTSSTAAGQVQAQNASFFGLASGEARGIAPKARVAAYKACFLYGCRGSDVLAAIEKAVEDGVDVISVSLGAAAARYSVDPIAIGAFGAVQKGVFFSAAAGNSGPSTETVSNIAPWITTVGASTIDRTFPVDLVLGNGEVVTGTSLYNGEMLDESKFFPIVHNTSTATVCMGSSLESKDVEGKIVICLSGGQSAPMKAVNVKNAGGVAIVVTNDDLYGEGLLSAPYFAIPGLSITYSASEKLFEYYKSTQDAKARIIFHRTMEPSGLAPTVAAFSSRGPNTESIYVLKPDVIAPGVDILASWPDNITPSRLTEDPRRSGFNIISGTSMSCPHVSGIAALLKGAHQDWSPAMIRSALMTTAYRNYPNGTHIVAQENNLEASVWLRGSGHVNPEEANNPGLVYDLGEDDYIDFMCASNYTVSEIKSVVMKEVSCENKTKAEWDLNYPAIVVATTQKVGNLSKVNVTVTRTLTNVESTSVTYYAQVVTPKGVTVSVKPTMLTFEAKGDKKSFQIQLLAEKDKASVMSTEEGLLTWNDGKHRVTIPLVVAIR